MTENQAKLIDEILKKLLKRNAGNRLDADDFYKELGISKDEAEHLIEIIIDITYNDDNIVHYHLGQMAISIRTSYNTKAFMKAGGCIGWFNRQMEIQQADEKKRELEQINLENAIRQFELSQEEYNRTRRQSIYFKWAAIISAIVSVSTLFLQIFGVI